MYYGPSPTTPCLDTCSCLPIESESTYNAEFKDMTVNKEDRKKVMEFLLTKLGDDSKPKTYTVEELWVLGKLANLVDCKINMDGTVELYDRPAGWPAIY